MFTMQILQGTNSALSVRQSDDALEALKVELRIEPQLLAPRAIAPMWMVKTLFRMLGLRQVRRLI